MNYNQYYLQDENYFYPNEGDSDSYEYSFYPYDNYNYYSYYQQQMLDTAPILPTDNEQKNHKSHRHRHHPQLPKEKSDIYKYPSSENSEPICIAIGDIEGNIHKLRSIIHFIKHSSFNFVFIGDIFDDISDASLTRKQGFECIYLISEFFSPVTEPYDLTFKSVRFEEKTFSEIENRVKFVAGNSECDVLKDIISTEKVRRNSEGKFVFGNGQYKKTFSEEQLSILYRYFKNCCGVISLSLNDKKKKFSGIVDSVFFRHSPEEFNHSHKIIHQMPKEKKHGANFNLSLLIVGHVHFFGPLLSSSLSCQIYSVDTSSVQKKQDKKADNRVAIVLYNPNNGFFVEPYYF